MRDYKFTREILQKDKSLCSENGFVYLVRSYASPFRLCFRVIYNAIGPLEILLPKSSSDTKQLLEITHGMNSVQLEQRLSKAWD